MLCRIHLFSHKSASSIWFIVIHPFTFFTCFPNIHPHISFHGNSLLHEDGTRDFHSLIIIFILLNSSLYHKLTSSQLTSHSGFKVVSGHDVSLGLGLTAPLWVVNPLYATVFQVSSLQIASTDPDGWL
jgi:hypothetical protein